MGIFFPVHALRGGWAILVALFLPAAVLSATTAGVRSEESAATPDRIVLTGAANFRDLGGMTTIDGRRIRPRTLFRSDNLSLLTGRDWQTLAEAGIRLVVDFRSEGEVLAAPPTQAADIERMALPIGLAEVDIAVLSKRIMAGEVDAIELPDSYARIAFESAGQYRRWFARLIDGEGRPTVFHCSSGKDRTGFGAAMLLTALGVRREMVLRDFVASNEFLHDRIERTVDRVRQRGPVDEVKLRALLGVRSQQMEHTLRAIEVRYGSIDRYLEVEMGLDATRRERLRALYLE
jgi:protein-tyrosine phosphatase